MDAPKLTVERLRELLHYDPETGVFTWKVTLSRRAVAGKTAGAFASLKGYTPISVLNVKYLAHRLAWFYVYGVWPSEDVDHINRVRSDNRITNLRLASRTENSQNAGLKRNNTSGYKGVSLHKTTRRWRAHLMVGRKQIHLGLFDCIHEAVAARKAAEAIYHPYAPKEVICA
jgi:hypothetical protein